MASSSFILSLIARESRAGLTCLLEAGFVEALIAIINSKAVVSLGDKKAKGGKKSSKNKKADKNGANKILTLCCVRDTLSTLLCIAAFQILPIYITLFFISHFGQCWRWGGRFVRHTHASGWYGWSQISKMLHTHAHHASGRVPVPSNISLAV